MKNQEKIKKRGNESHEFIYCIGNPIGSLYVFHFSLSNTYISDSKRDCN